MEGAKWNSLVDEDNKPERFLSIISTSDYKTMMNEDLGNWYMWLYFGENEGSIDIIRLHGHGTYFAVNNGI